MADGSGGVEDREPMFGRRYRHLKDPVLLIAVGLLAASAVLVLRTGSLVSRCGHARGVITGYVSADPGVPAGAGSPMAIYEAQGGSYGLLVGTPERRSEYPIGKSIALLYLLDEPSRSWVDDPWSLYGVPAVGGCLGFLLVFAWAISGRCHHRKR